MNNLSKASKRWDLINYLIEKYDCKSYLEIGVEHGVSMNQVFCDHKTGVDPVQKFKTEDLKADAFYEMTSDVFFDKHAEDDYDIAFIDGLHEEFQVLRDILNCLNYVNKVIVLHDCNPPNLQHESLNLCGTVWRAMYRIVQAYPRSFVLDMDYGCGVIIVPDYDELGTRKNRRRELEVWANLVGTIKEWIDSEQADPSISYKTLEADRSIIRLTNTEDLEEVL